jgi:hypothetical protein
MSVTLSEIADIVDGNDPIWIGVFSQCADRAFKNSEFRSNSVPLACPLVADSEAPTASPASLLTEVELPCREVSGTAHFDPIPVIDA